MRVGPINGRLAGEFETQLASENWSDGHKRLKSVLRIDDDNGWNVRFLVVHKIAGTITTTEEFDGLQAAMRKYDSI